jgi:hypothetical protein
MLAKNISLMLMNLGGSTLGDRVDSGLPYRRDNVLSRFFCPRGVSGEQDNSKFLRRPNLVHHQRPMRISSDSLEAVEHPKDSNTSPAASSETHGLDFARCRSLNNVIFKHS